MPDLSFQITGVEAVTRGLTPLLHFKLHITSPTAADIIQGLLLDAQIQIQSPERLYASSEKEKLVDLFGPSERWGQTVRSLMWAETSVMVPGFVEEAKIDLPLPCTYDFNIATCKYFYALDDGVIPLGLLFSGTIFYAGDDGNLQIEQISWERETTFGLPVAVWKDMMEQYYPNCAWLNLRRDVFDELYRFKSRRGLPTWEKALEALLAEEMVAT